MKRYIDRDVLADYACRHYGGLTASEIMRFPTADVEPVKHGRWEYDHTIGGMKHYHCTNCKNSGNECIADENEILWWEFCPRCSARMDLKDGDSDAI